MGSGAFGGPFFLSLSGQANLGLPRELSTLNPIYLVAGKTYPFFRVPYYGFLYTAP